MIRLIIGEKGSGKTKRLIKEINNAMFSSRGNIVCIEKEPNLRYHVSSRIRLVCTENTVINNADRLIGYIQGIADGNYDITDIFLDATFKIISKDLTLVDSFLKELNKISENSNINICLTLSCNRKDIKNYIADYHVIGG